MKLIITTIAALITMATSAFTEDLSAARYHTEVLCAEGECSPGHEKMITKAKDRLSSVLREPESAKFRDLYITTGKDMKALTVCGLVKARNGFGGMTGYKKFFITEDDALLVMRNRKDALLPQWHYHCDPKGWR